MTTGQGWVLLGIIGTMASGILALVAMSQSNLKAFVGEKFAAVDQRFDGLDRRLEALDRDVQVLFRDR